MSTKSEQLLLDLPHREALGREDFLVTTSNAAAVELIDQWPNWPSYAAIIVGPESCGKSHLVEVWRQRSAALKVQAQDLTTPNVPKLFIGKAVAIEDLQEIDIDERAVFHALNFAKQEAKFILFTSRQLPNHFSFKLPDLASRLNSLPVVQIEAPDDILLRGVLVKLFADRQLAVDEGLINYTLMRMPRSLAIARKLVAEIDQLALTEKAEVSKTLVAKVLATLENLDLFTTL
jgi:chromosomal replication initiation ATPase DnaA